MAIVSSAIHWNNQDFLNEQAYDWICCCSTCCSSIIIFLVAFACGILLIHQNIKFDLPLENITGWWNIFYFVYHNWTTWYNISLSLSLFRTSKKMSIPVSPTNLKMVISVNQKFRIVNLEFDDLNWNKCLKFWDSL